MMLFCNLFIERTSYYVLYLRMQSSCILLLVK